MFLAKTFFLVCLALGAVRAGAQQLPLNSQLVRVPNHAIAIGTATEICVTIPAGGHVQAAVFMGFDLGSTPASVFGKSIVLPISNSIAQVASAQLAGGAHWKPGITVPANPSLVGLTPYLSVVLVRNNAIPLVSAALPFGPIIEDSIQ